jgi:hypothetical protein
MASAANNGTVDQKGAGWMTAYNTGGCSTLRSVSSSWVGALHHSSIDRFGSRCRGSQSALGSRLWSSGSFDCRPFDEREDVRIDQVGMSRHQAVWEARINLERAMFQQLGLQQ